MAQNFNTKLLVIISFVFIGCTITKKRKEFLYKEENYIVAMKYYDSTLVEIKKPNNKYLYLKDTFLGNSQITIIKRRHIVSYFHSPITKNFGAIYIANTYNPKKYRNGVVVFRDSIMIGSVSAPVIIR